MELLELDMIKGGSLSLPSIWRMSSQWQSSKLTNDIHVYMILIDWVTRLGKPYISLFEPMTMIHFSVETFKGCQHAEGPMIYLGTAYKHCLITTDTSSCLFIGLV